MRKQLTGAQLKERLNRPAVDFCENADEGGLDDGRYFVHLRTGEGWTYNEGNGPQLTASSGSVKEARAKLRKVTREAI